jgi:hypothetical protein
VSSSIPPVRTDVLALVRPEFREAFLRFVDAGELDPEFEKYLYRDERCQQAVEAVAEAQLEVMSAAGRQLRDTGAGADAVSSGMVAEAAREQELPVAALRLTNSR